MTQKVFNLVTVDGVWNTWTSWTTCSASCDFGTHSRDRVCDDPAPRFGGKDCAGASQEEDICDSGTHCPGNFLILTRLKRLNFDYVSLKSDLF